MAVSHKACLPLVRSQEPSFLPKLNYRFDVPAECLNDRYKDLGVEISERFGDDDPDDLIPLPQIKLPDLTLAKKLPRDATFSIFIAVHRKYALELLKIFDACKTVDELIATALYVRDQVNPFMFAYAYSVTLAHRKDTQSIVQPQLVEIFPSKFLKRDVLHLVREQTYVVPEKLRKPIVLPFNLTASNMDPEQRMAYFREDIGVNSHHWHWHLVFPVFGPDPSFFDKDRRGELFFYMHQQILCRYNTDRICNGLHVVEPYANFRELLNPGYFPKMDTVTSGRNIPPRQPNAVLKDLRRDFEFMAMTVNNLDMHRSRCAQAIDEGFMVDWQGNRVELNNDQGIDILGNLIEATALSFNPRYYGSVHNDGHTFIALCHDPEGRHNEDSGVMGDTTTAMRDPIFYRWHTMINELFLVHKLNLMPYTEAQLGFQNIRIDGVDLACGGKLVDELRTYWQRSNVNLQSGLDFAANEPIYVSFTHLNYEKFSYLIRVTNSSDKDQWGTVRIFLCSINNEAQQPYFLEGMRKNAIEMDRFVIKLSPGSNLIRRQSVESTVTIPYELTFPQVNVTKSGTSLPSDVPQDVQQYCMCGWPDHLLLPKGTVEGFPCRLFVMISDYTQDTVRQDMGGICSESAVFCGLRDRRYPDARPMGFPFDRPFDFNFGIIEDVVQRHPNMFNRNVQIRHINEILRMKNADNLNVVNDPEPPENYGTNPTSPPSAQP